MADKKTYQAARVPESESRRDVRTGRGGDQVLERHRVLVGGTAVASAVADADEVGIQVAVCGPHDAGLIDARLRIVAKLGFVVIEQIVRLIDQLPVHP